MFLCSHGRPQAVPHFGNEDDSISTLELSPNGEYLLCASPRSVVIFTADSRRRPVARWFRSAQNAPVFGPLKKFHWGNDGTSIFALSENQKYVCIFELTTFSGEVIPPGGAPSFNRNHSLSADSRDKNRDDNRSPGQSPPSATSASSSVPAPSARSWFGSSWFGSAASSSTSTADEESTNENKNSTWKVAVTTDSLTVEGSSGANGNTSDGWGGTKKPSGEMTKRIEILGVPKRLEMDRTYTKLEKNPFLVRRIVLKSILAIPILVSDLLICSLEFSEGPDSLNLPTESKSGLGSIRESPQSSPTTDPIGREKVEDSFSKSHILCSSLRQPCLYILDTDHQAKSIRAVVYISDLTAKFIHTSSPSLVTNSQHQSNADSIATSPALSMAGHTSSPIITQAADPSLKPSNSHVAGPSQSTAGSGSTHSLWGKQRKSSSSNSRNELSVRLPPLKQYWSRSPGQPSNQRISKLPTGKVPPRITSQLTSPNLSSSHSETSISPDSLSRLKDGAALFASNTFVCEPSIAAMMNFLEPRRHLVRAAKDPTDPSPGLTNSDNLGVSFSVLSEKLGLLAVGLVCGWVFLFSWKCHAFAFTVESASVRCLQSVEPRVRLRQRRDRGPWILAKTKAKTIEDPNTYSYGYKPTDKGARSNTSTQSSQKKLAGQNGKHPNMPNSLLEDLTSPPLGILLCCGGDNKRSMVALNFSENLRLMCCLYDNSDVEFLPVDQLSVCRYNSSEQTFLSNLTPARKFSLMYLFPSSPSLSMPSVFFTSPNGIHLTIGFVNSGIHVLDLSGRRIFSSTSISQDSNDQPSHPSGSAEFELAETGQRNRKGLLFSETHNPDDDHNTLGMFSSLADMSSTNFSDSNFDRPIVSEGIFAAVWAARGLSLVVASKSVPGHLTQYEFFSSGALPVPPLLTAPGSIGVRWSCDNNFKLLIADQQILVCSSSASHAYKAIWAAKRLPLVTVTQAALSPGTSSLLLLNCITESTNEPCLLMSELASDDYWRIISLVDNYASMPVSGGPSDSTKGSVSNATVSEGRNESNKNSVSPTRKDENANSVTFLHDCPIGWLTEDIFFCFVCREMGEKEQNTDSINNSYYNSSSGISTRSPSTPSRNILKLEHQSPVLRPTAKREPESVNTKSTPLSKGSPQSIGPSPSDSDAARGRHMNSPNSKKNSKIRFEMRMFKYSSNQTQASTNRNGTTNSVVLECINLISNLKHKPLSVSTLDLKTDGHISLKSKSLICNKHDRSSVMDPVFKQLLISTSSNLVELGNATFGPRTPLVGILDETKIFSVFVAHPKQLLFHKRDCKYDRHDLFLKTRLSHHLIQRSPRHGRHGKIRLSGLAGALISPRKLSRSSQSHPTAEPLDKHEDGDDDDDDSFCFVMLYSVDLKHTLSHIPMEIRMVGSPYTLFVRNHLGSLQIGHVTLQAMRLSKKCSTVARRQNNNTDIIFHTLKVGSVSEPGLPLGPKLAQIMSLASVVRLKPGTARLYQKQSSEHDTGYVLDIIKQKFSIVMSPPLFNGVPVSEIICGRSAQFDSFMPLFSKPTLTFEYTIPSATSAPQGECSSDSCEEDLANSSVKPQETSGASYPYRTTSGFADRSASLDVDDSTFAHTADPWHSTDYHLTRHPAWNLVSAALTKASRNTDGNRIVSDRRSDPNGEKESAVQDVTVSGNEEKDDLSSTGSPWQPRMIPRLRRSSEALESKSSAPLRRSYTSKTYFTNETVPDIKNKFIPQSTRKCGASATRDNGDVDDGNLSSSNPVTAKQSLGKSEGSSSVSSFVSNEEAAFDKSDTNTNHHHDFNLSSDEMMEEDIDGESAATPKSGLTPSDAVSSADDRKKITKNSPKPQQETSETPQIDKKLTKDVVRLPSLGLPVAVRRTASKEISCDEIKERGISMETGEEDNDEEGDEDDESERLRHQATECYEDLLLTGCESMSMEIASKIISPSARIRSQMLVELASNNVMEQSHEGSDFDTSGSSTANDISLLTPARQDVTRGNYDDNSCPSQTSTADVLSCDPGRSEHPVRHPRQPEIQLPELHLQKINKDFARRGGNNVRLISPRPSPKHSCDVFLTWTESDCRKSLRRRARSFAGTSSPEKRSCLDERTPKNGRPPAGLEKISSNNKNSAREYDRLNNWRSNEFEKANNFLGESQSSCCFNKQQFETRRPQSVDSPKKVELRRRRGGMPFVNLPKVLRLGEDPSGVIERDRVSCLQQVKNATVKKKLDSDHCSKWSVMRGEEPESLGDTGMNIMCRYCRIAASAGSSFELNGTSKFRQSEVPTGCSEPWQLDMSYIGYVAAGQYFSMGKKFAMDVDIRSLHLSTSDPIVQTSGTQVWISTGSSVVLLNVSVDSEPFFPASYLTSRIKKWNDLTKGPHEKRRRLSRSRKIPLHLVGRSKLYTQRHVYRCLQVYGPAEDLAPVSSQTDSRSRLRSVSLTAVAARLGLMLLGHPGSRCVSTATASSEGRRVALPQFVTGYYSSFTYKSVPIADALISHLMESPAIQSLDLLEPSMSFDRIIEADVPANGNKSEDETSYLLSASEISSAAIRMHSWPDLYDLSFRLAIDSLFDSIVPNSPFLYLAAEQALQHHLSGAINAVAKHLSSISHFLKLICPKCISDIKRNYTRVKSGTFRSKAPSISRANLPLKCSICCKSLQETQSPFSGFDDPPVGHLMSNFGSKFCILQTLLSKHAPPLVAFWRLCRLLYVAIKPTDAAALIARVTRTSDPTVSPFISFPLSAMDPAKMCLAAAESRAFAEGLLFLLPLQTLHGPLEVRTKFVLPLLEAAICSGSVAAAQKLLSFYELIFTSVGSSWITVISGDKLRIPFLAKPTAVVHDIEGDMSLRRWSADYSFISSWTVEDEYHALRALEKTISDSLVMLILDFQWRNLLSITIGLSLHLASWIKPRAELLREWSVYCPPVPINVPNTDCFSPLTYAASVTSGSQITPRTPPGASDFACHVRSPRFIASVIGGTVERDADGAPLKPKESDFPTGRRRSQKSQINGPVYRNHEEFKSAYLRFRMYQLASSFQNCFMCAERVVSISSLDRTEIDDLMTQPPGNDDFDPGVAGASLRPRILLNQEEFLPSDWCVGWIYSAFVILDLPVLAAAVAIGCNDRATLVRTFKWRRKALSHLFHDDSFSF